MASAQPYTGVAVEEFVEFDEVAPIRVGLELLPVTIEWPAVCRR